METAIWDTRDTISSFEGPFTARTIVTVVAQGEGLKEFADYAKLNTLSNTAFPGSGVGEASPEVVLRSLQSAGMSHIDGPVLKFSTGRGLVVISGYEDTFKTALLDSGILGKEFKQAYEGLNVREERKLKGIWARALNLVGRRPTMHIQQGIEGKPGIVMHKEFISRGPDR